MSKPPSGYFTNTSGEGKILIQEVIDLGYKITPEDVVGIMRDKNGDIIWLEKGHLGTNPSGLSHILDAHEKEFNKQGIPTSDVGNFILHAVANGEIVGYQGKGNTRPIYQVNYGGKVYRVAVTIGSNGYIVGANPASFGGTK